MTKRHHTFQGAARRLLRLPEVRHQTGLSTTEIYRRMAGKAFPVSIRIGPRQVAWDSLEIQDWVLLQLDAQREAE